ncbi:Cystathionine beta-lyase [Acrodontium crateriforme]|uniref:Cystathionine beta-lyase n=1 Tax=Acrodontium crateriforme TaxID=150365 RepID=A0AAQ3M1D6_9PEZI|nr:Cystathionine beta-lyase [Acrodontium crateriforme]
MSSSNPSNDDGLHGVGKALKHLDLDGHNLPPSPAPSTPTNGRKYALATELVFTEGGDQYNSSSVPIYQSATFKGGPGQEYDYTRSGNPTRSHLERHLAKIMSANRALVVSSGMGACDVITRVLKPGDEVVTGDDLYGGTNRLLTYLKQNMGIVVHHVDTTDVEKTKAVLSEKTTMVLLETPTNPLIKIIDIAGISEAAHKANASAIVAVDNTMMSPYLQNPLDLGADVVYESGTKYLSGHHDVMAGVIAVNNAALGDKFFFMINSTGCGLSPFDSWLLLRGVKTLAIRMEKQQANSMAIAQFLEGHGFKVRYPGLKSHPQYALHWSQARGAGAVLSFETGSIELSERIVESANLFGISVSFGCVNSLISMPCRMSHASIDPATRKERALPEDIIRLCVGIEDINDLIDDLSQALVRAGAVKLTDDGFVALVRSELVGQTGQTTQVVDEP